MFPKTYLLGQHYYEDVAHAADAIIEYGKTNTSIKDFTAFIEAEDLEKKRFNEEYLIELLILGTLWINYSRNAVKLSPSKSKLLQNLYQLREKTPSLKPHVDSLRGVLQTKYLLKQETFQVKISKENFNKLLNWLAASGEFNEELRRFKNWQKYIETISDVNFKQVIHSAIALSEHMRTVCSNYLKGYLGNTKLFLKTQATEYKNRENIIFTGRKHNEYYLNMICAEILNRVYRKKFLATKNKIVLLPTCMSIGEQCKGVKTDFAYDCMECTDSCNISKISKLGKTHNFKVQLIPHSSNFSKYLEQWKNQEHTGLIGVACLLNLLTGGYEMRRLNIPSQCVLLNFSGCAKHWGDRKATELFKNQLLKTLEE